MPGSHCMIFKVVAAVLTLHKYHLVAIVGIPYNGLETGGHTLHNFSIANNGNKSALFTNYIS